MGWDGESTSRAFKIKAVAACDVTEGKRERERESLEQDSSEQERIRVTGRANDPRDSRAVDESYPSLSVFPKCGVGVLED